MTLHIKYAAFMEMFKVCGAKRHIKMEKSYLHIISPHRQHRNAFSRNVMIYFWLIIFVAKMKNIRTYAFFAHCATKRIETLICRKTLVFLANNSSSCVSSTGFSSLSLSLIIFARLPQFIQSALVVAFIYSR